MCGIGGIRRFGAEKIEEYQIYSLLLSNERRGNDATGVAIQNEGEEGIRIWKSAKPASTAVQGKDFEEFLRENLKENTQTVLVHTRAATSSDFRDNQNNHPLFRDDVAVVHNGVITNHERVFEELKTQSPNCPTDSDVIRGILDEYGLNEEGMKGLNKLNGSMAIAAISVERPGWLLLAKSGSPLHIGLTRDQLIFASERDFVYDAARPYVIRFGVVARPLRAELAFTPMGNNSGWLFGPNGLTLRREIVTTNFQRTEPDRTKYNSEFNKRRLKGKEVCGVGEMAKLPEEIRCGKCGKINSLAPKQRFLRLGQLTCGECDTSLAESGGQKLLN